MKNIKEVRKLNNKTQDKIAKLLGISQSNYAKYENEKIDTPNDILIKLANYFNVTTDYLLGIEEMNYINSGNNNVITGNGININSSFKNSNNPNTNTNLSDEEQQLINDFRKLSKDKQAAIKLLLK